MELHLISAAFAKRENLYLMLEYIAQKEYTREFQIIINKAREYYDRDPDATSIDPAVFMAVLANAVQNKKHLENFQNLINEAQGIEGVANVEKLILDAKLNEIAQQLSVALINGDKTVPDLMERYRELQHYNTLDDLTSVGTEMLTADDLDTVFDHLINREGYLQVYPMAFNERLDGGAAGGHHIVTFARPEMGKSAFNITIACGFARQKAHGIYFINEDRIEDIYARIVSNLSGFTVMQIRFGTQEERALAKQRARENGLDYIRRISLAPGTLKQVEAFVDKFRPRWIIMDQLRNLDVKEANKVLQLEYATSGMRNIGKKYNVLVISSTQAGDSAENKKLLTMGDVDFSNTGVAAQADVLVGIGGDQADQEQDRRIINLSKNKLSGRHENFPVKINRPLSRYLSYRQQEDDNV